TSAGRYRVVVVGGGFGGLETVKALRGAPVEVTLIDRNNYHLFQPLNYQVATGALSPDEIAEPLRTIFRRDARVHIVMGEVTDVDLAQRIVRDTLPGDFRAIDPRIGRVLLVETEDRVLPSFPARLSGRAAESLEELGVMTLVSHTVVGIDPYGAEVQSDDGQRERVAARTVIW